MKRFLLTLALIMLPSVATGQLAPTREGLAGLPIEKVEVSGNTSVAESTIRVYLGLETGNLFFPESVRTNYLNLWQTGLFDNVKVEADRGETGVIVRVTVVERPRIGAIEYRGNKELTTANIAEALEIGKVDLNVGRTVDQAKIRRAAEVIETAYAENGFDGVTVTPRLEDRPTPNEKRIVFEINEGIKARIDKIVFDGNDRFSDWRLRRAMKEVKTHNLYTWARKRNLYIPSKLDADLELVRNLYLDHGYKDVQFGDLKIDQTPAKRPFPFIGKKAPQVKLTIPVKEGTVHTFRSASVTGNNVFTDDQILGKWPLEEGQTLERSPIQRRIEFFEEAYRRRGYIYAYINSVYHEVEEDVVDVEIEIYEGDQFRLGRLEFEGNTTTKDKVLRREIFLNEGMIMDMETFKASMYKIGQLGYFKVTENPDFQVNPEDKTVDITVKGREEGKNDIQFGGGYSEAYGFFGTFQFSTRNLLGNGNTLGLSYQRGRRQDFFSLAYTDPWFLDRPHSVGVSIFNRNTILPESVGFESRGKGGTASYGYRIGRFESLSFTYGFENRTERTEFVAPPDDNGNIPLPNVFDSEFTTSAVIPAYRYDSRDNPFDTFRGMRASVAFSYVGGPVLGGSINILKPVLNYTYYKPITAKGSLAFNAEGGAIFPLDDNCANFFDELEDFENRLCVPRSERFFVGGEQSVRGFKPYTLGPREEVNGRLNVVGGYSYSVFNLEYIQRINDPLRFVLFADAGQAFAYEENFDLSKLRYSVGAEMRVFLPVFQFPLRFIYAFNPDEQEGDGFEAFQFSIGNTF